MILVQAIPTFSNHYQWAIWHHSNAQIVAIVDPIDASAIFDWLDNGALHDGQALKTARTIESILLTNRQNSDQTVVDQLRNRFNEIKVFDALSSAQATDGQANNPQTIEVVGAKAQVLPIPGYFNDALAFWFRDDTRVFTGSTLSSIGCAGFNADQAQTMWSSLQKLRALPDFTMMYCAQEVTEINCQFALHVDPDNRLLQQRSEEVKSLRAASKPTIPTSIGLECLTNPFLRVDELSFATAPDMQDATAAELLAALQAAKVAYQ
jgi:hydroxyacylglutathione hydrolase